MPRATPRAADDAQACGLFLPEALSPMAFDHALILTDYRQWLATGAAATLCGVTRWHGASR